MKKETKKGIGTIFLSIGILLIGLIVSIVIFLYSFFIVVIFNFFSGRTQPNLNATKNDIIYTNNMYNCYHEDVENLTELYYDDYLDTNLNQINLIYIPNKDSKNYIFFENVKNYKRITIENCDINLYNQIVDLSKKFDNSAILFKYSDLGFTVKIMLNRDKAYTMEISCSNDNLSKSFSTTAKTDTGTSLVTHASPFTYYKYFN